MRRLLTAREAAERIGVPYATFRSWKHRGQAPVGRQPAGPGSQTLYEPEVIELFKLRMKGKTDATLSR